MRLIILLICSLSTLAPLQAQERIIYNDHLVPYEGIQSIQDLEKMLDHKVMTRMYSVRKEKIFQYYKAATGEFVGFSANLDKINLTDIPYFKKMKGLKKLLRKYDAKQALEVYYQQQTEVEET